MVERGGAGCAGWRPRGSGGGAGPALGEAASAPRGRREAAPRGCGCCDRGPGVQTLYGPLFCKSEKLDFNFWVFFFLILRVVCKGSLCCFSHRNTGSLGIVY